LLSVLVLLSSTNVTFAMHYCMGELESIALFSEAGTCDMAKQKKTASASKHGPDCHQHQMAAKNCCEDQTLVLEGIEELSLVKSFEIPDFQMTAMLYALVSCILTSQSVDYYTFDDYSPPPIERDITVLVQSFLI